MKSFLLLLVILLNSYSFAQTLKIGTTSSFPPFSSAANEQKNLFGFDIELMEEVCKRINIKCTFVISTYNDLFIQLKKSKIDLVVSGIIITPEMQNHFLFSIPYLKSHGRFLTLQQSNINRIDDIFSKKIGTRKGTPFKNAALVLFKNKVKVQEYPSLFDLLIALKQKKIDAALINDEAAEYWNANGGNTYKLIAQKIPVGNGYVVMTNKGQNKLMAKINQAIKSITSDGTFLKMYKRHIK